MVMFSHSRFGSPADSADERRVRARLHLEALEDRLPPGQVGFGSLALAMMGPSLSLVQLDALTPDRGQSTAVPVDQRPAESGFGFTPAALDSTPTLTLNHLPASTDQANTQTTSDTPATDVAPILQSDAGTTSAFDELAQSALAAHRAALAQPASNGIEQAGHTASSTVVLSPDGGPGRDIRSTTPLAVLPADNSTNVNQGRAALLVAALSANAGGLGGGNVNPQDVVIGDNVRVNTRTNCNGRGVIQSETAIAVSGNAVVVAYNDFRGFYCSGRQLTGWGYSLDSGATFTEGANLPGGNGWYGDPWLATGPDGTIYLASLWNGTNSIAVARGTVTNTGIDWSQPTIIRGGSFDKEAITVDQTYGTIYLSYTNLGNGIYLYKSIDGGVTFQGPTRVGTATNAQGSQPAVGPDGELYIAYGVGYPNDSAIGVAVSYDTGASFYVNNNIAPVTRANIPGTDRAPYFPHIAVDTTGGPYNENVYITWDSAHLSGKLDSLMITSSDYGATWSAPVKINDTATGIQWYPTVAVDANGNVDSFFYDRRENPGTTITNLYFAQSTDGGHTFNANIKATTASSNWHTFSDGSPAWGDYINSTNDGADSVVAYADGRDGDPDAYFIRAAAV
jgi:hypothetical protein